jgi:hypothetical protein
MITIPCPPPPSTRLMRAASSACAGGARRRAAALIEFMVVLVVAFVSPCHAAPPTETTASQPSVAPPQASASAPATPVAVGPRVPEDLPEKLLAARGKGPIMVVEGLVGQLPVDAVTVSVKEGAGGVIGGRAEPAGSGKGWDLWVAEKRLGRLRQAGGELLLDQPTEDAVSLLEHLVLEVRPEPNGQAVKVRLNRPAPALLQVRSLRARESRAGGKSAKKSTASIPHNGRFSLFDDAAVNAKIAWVVEAYPDLVERFEFSAGLGSRSRMADRNGREWPSIAFTDVGGRGVELRRISTKPLEYQWSGLAFPLRYGQFNKQYADTKVFDERLLEEIPRKLKIDLDRLSESFLYEDRRLYRNLTEAAMIDKESMDAAEAFPIESLQGRPVRLTLGRPGAAGGFVLVDSLEQTPADSRSASSPARASP